MDFSQFQGSLRQTAPPDVSSALQALWYDGKGDWKAAHDRLQDQDDRDSAWVHAYLHRKEGDISNAGYWYRRAGQPAAQGPLDEEWTSLVNALL
jgi:hypothetical protein